MTMNPALRRAVMENIEQYGVHLFGIFDGSPPFTYTIGLSSKFGFELLCVGLSPSKAGGLLNVVAAMHLPPELNVPNDELANLPTMFRECNKDLELLHAEYVHQADLFYGREVKVVQLVMPDRAGRFPEHPEFDHEYMDPRQPLFCK